MPNGTRQQWLSVREIAQQIAISEKAIRAAIRRGELTATKLCSRVRIAPDDFDSWIVQNRISPEKKLRYEPDVTSTAGPGLRSLLRQQNEGATA